MSPEVVQDDGVSAVHGGSNGRQPGGDPARPRRRGARLRSSSTAEHDKLPSRHYVNALIWLATFITLGSGLLNIYSVIGRGLPERLDYLREMFPLEFIRLSRFGALLTGLGLVISSVQIRRRKRRAFVVVSLLACLSAVFHLTKGIDYEEAAVSFALFVLLLAARKSFDVRSGTPRLRRAALSISLAALVVIGYGTAGFWLLERRDFGVELDVSESLRNTFLVLSLVKDPAVIAHTRHARWFVESLYLLTFTLIGYAALALFRPVIYQLRSLPHERAHASGLVEKYGHSALDYFKLWPDKSLFFSGTRESFLAYSVGAGHAMVLSDPVGPEGELEALVREFSHYCRGQGWGLAFHQTLPDFLPVYRRLGFRKLKIGDEAVVDLTRFDLAGKRMKKLRHKVNHLEDDGVHVVQFEPPLTEELLAELREVSDDWLRLPGRRERRFSLGHFDPAYVRATPIFAVAERDQRIVAFANRVPSYARGEATIDLMRHRQDAPNGTMDYLFVKLLLDCKARGFERFSLGMAPLAGFGEREEASPEERAVYFFLHNLNFLFSYTGLKQYKAKFADTWEPRYLVYQNILDLPKVALALTRVSEMKE